MRQFGRFSQADDRSDIIGPGPPTTLLRAPDEEGLETRLAIDVECANALRRMSEDEPGGLSGTPLQARATAVIRFLQTRTSLPIMAAVGKPAAKESLPEKLQKAESPNGRRPLTASICEGPFRL